VAASAAAAPAPALAVRGLTVTIAAAAPVVAVDATMITVAHWGRVEDGELFAWSRRLEWAVMMKRTFGFAVLTCPQCSRTMRVLSTITEPAVVTKILEHLGVRAAPLPRAPARDPEWEQASFGFDADAAYRRERTSHETFPHAEPAGAEVCPRCTIRPRGPPEEGPEGATVGPRAPRAPREPAGDYYPPRYGAVRGGAGGAPRRVREGAAGGAGRGDVGAAALPARFLGHRRAGALSRRGSSEVLAAGSGGAMLVLFGPIARRPGHDAGGAGDLPGRGRRAPREASVPDDAEVVVTFLTAGSRFETSEDMEEPVPGSFAEDAPPLDDFEPIVPVQPVRLSDLVLEDRR
jgi:hypothetical protein